MRKLNQKTCHFDRCVRRVYGKKRICTFENPKTYTQKPLKYKALEVIFVFCVRCVRCFYTHIYIEKFSTLEYVRGARAYR